MKMCMRSQQRTKHLKVLKYRKSVASFSSTNCQNPELHSKENIGVNKPNTEGNKPAWFSIKVCIYMHGFSINIMIEFEIDKLKFRASHHGCLIFEFIANYHK